MPNKNYKILFGEYGMYEYDAYSAYTGIVLQPGIEYLDNYVFEATLKFNNVFRGRSATTFSFTDIQTNLTYYMNLSSFETVLRKCNILEGQVTARFTFQKRGQNYSLVLTNEPVTIP